MRGLESVCVPIGELEKDRREAVKSAVRAGRALGRAAGLAALRDRAIEAIVKGRGRGCSRARGDGNGGGLVVVRQYLLSSQARLKLEVLSHRRSTGKAWLPIAEL